MPGIPAIDVKVTASNVAEGALLEARAFAPDGRPLPVVRRCLVRWHVLGDLIRMHGRRWGLEEAARSLREICERAALRHLGFAPTTVFTIS